MRRYLIAFAVALAAFMPGAVFAESPADGPAASAPAPSAPVPVPASTSTAAIAPRRESVTEYVLYRGAFDDENRQPLFSDPELDVVKAHRIDELRAALKAGYARPTYSIGRRQCSYPLGGKGGNVRLAMGSTCDENEVI